MNYLKFLWRLLTPREQGMVIGLILVLEAAVIWWGFRP